MPEKYTPMPASKLGEYTIVGDIAEGTFGKVRSASAQPRVRRRRADIGNLFSLVAMHSVTGHKVAMKFISKRVIHATKTKTRVQREVEYMRALRHPHIIKL